MVTENDAIITKLREHLAHDWKINGISKELPPQATILYENGVVQIDPRFTSHA